MNTTDEMDFGDEVFVSMVADVIGCSMATWVIVEERIPEWQDWIRAKVLTASEDDPEDVRKMYQMIGKASQETVELAIEIFVHDRRQAAKVMTKVMELFK